MVKCALGISYFNNVKEIPRLLDPLYKRFDMVIAIDGRYPKFDWPSNVSTDGSTELLISKYGAFVQLNKDPIEQIDKRNQYMEIAEKAGMDFVLVLDTDDYLHKDYQDFDLFYKQLEEMPKEECLGNMWFWMNPQHRDNWNIVKDDSWNLYTRIMRPDRIRYYTSHYTYIDRQDPDVYALAKIEIDGIRFDSDSVYRTEEYMKKGYEWAGIQLDEEMARFEEPKAKRMKFNLWCREIDRCLKNPRLETKIIEGAENLPKELAHHRNKKK